MYALALTCAMDCKTPPIIGTEELTICDPPPRDFPIRGQDLGHVQINYGRGIMEDIEAEARKAGWHWDGSRWLCSVCAAHSRAIIERFDRFRETISA